MKRDDPDACELAPPWPASWSDAGVIEVLEPLITDQRRQRITEVADRRVGSVTVVMDAPRDPHNGAAVVRTCDAFGLLRLHVVRRIEPFLISRRIACGTQRWVDVVQYTTPELAISALQREGFTLVTAHVRGELTPTELATMPKVALVLGNEHDGICQQLLDAATHSVRIPMRGFVESLNLSVSAAIFIQAATQPRPGDLSLADRQRFYAKALHASVARAPQVLAASRPR